MPNVMKLTAKSLRIKLLEHPSSDLYLTITLRHEADDKVLKDLTFN